MFNFTVEERNKLGCFWTTQEIYQQPATWNKTINQIKGLRNELKAFLSQVLDEEFYDVILTGAGTSEFVGNSIYTEISKVTNFQTKSYGTTDLVATPENYLSRNKKTLLVSFGRSGNSPESVGAVEVANTVCGDNIFHLFVTCNEEGALSKYAVGKKNCFAINLAPETHDQSFAMTSSYTNMYLATYLAFHLEQIEAIELQLNKVAVVAQDFVDHRFLEVKNIIDTFEFDRIVYLGSNVNKGVSQEVALKICELTAGKTVTMYDTPLGFRHGPKSVINPQTLTVIFLSDDHYTRQFEIDLIKEMSGERNGNKIVAISSKEDTVVKELVDYFISLNLEESFSNIYLGLHYAIIGQLIGLYKALSMNNSPDNPNPSGVVNRVVKGVILYPYEKK